MLKKASGRVYPQTIRNCRQRVCPRLDVRPRGVALMVLLVLAHAFFTYAVGVSRCIEYRCHLGAPSGVSRCTERGHLLECLLVEKRSLYRVVGVVSSVKLLNKYITLCPKYFVGWDWFYIGSRPQETQPNQILRRCPIAVVVSLVRHPSNNFLAVTSVLLVLIA